MGVPKFYRWISERYPCLSEVVKEFQLPEFDNLYLDMNGIIHVCSHPDDENPHFRITEEKIFKDICHYIDFLFRMIKPRKVFFMAVDGVAPRAKMNQQRSRRFRSAREAEVLIQKAVEKGEVLPTEQRFDSNCITPGTPFMVRLQEHLKYFVVDKITHDPLWQGPRIYLSGHETPGEGEHKVMDFIRYSKSQPDHDPDTRHCLYGLDADLIMLGLTSHEPHFSLLREEVRFGGKKDSRNKRPVTPEETTFHLLHLSLLRDYLAYEFTPLKGKLSFEWNLENIIDDWILMGFLVGNDFIPHLPHLHIHHDALPLLWKTYMTVLPQLDGYLNEEGHLNLPRFEKYFEELSKYDEETFESAFSDLKYLESKIGGKSVNESAGQAKKAKMKKLQPFEMDTNGVSLEALEPASKLAAPIGGQFSALVDLDGLSDDSGAEDEDGSSVDEIDDEIDEDDDDDDFDTFGAEFTLHKRDYYMSKLAYKEVTPEVLEDQARGYVTALQWILLYYFDGCPSWSWFYPHHYAPYISDVKGFKDMKIEFDLGKPFLPFQQLMAVLPAASKELLPPAMQPLMTEGASPVIDFYPVDFATDLNGKQQDWEAVVLIPFIEEERLLTAMATKEPLLTKEEKSRNRHGPHVLFEYSEETMGFYPSSLPGSFPDIHVSRAKKTELHQELFHIDPNKLRKGLLDSVRLDVYFPGFPTLNFLPHTHELKKAGVKVFQHNSRGENMVLHVRSREGLRLEEVADQLLGKSTHVGWPHLHEAKVVAVANESFKIELVEEVIKKGDKPLVSFQRKPLHGFESDEVCRDASFIKERQMDRFAIDVGNTEIVIYACPMTGRTYTYGDAGAITLDKQFSTKPIAYVHQMTIKDLQVEESGHTTFKTLEEVFPVGSTVFMRGLPHYGAQGKVREVLPQDGRVRISVSVTQEPDYQLLGQYQKNGRYYSGHSAAQYTGVESHFLSRITGSVFVEKSPTSVGGSGGGGGGGGKANIGLNLKFTKRKEEVPGYTHFNEEYGGWQYSDKCLDVVKEYIYKFRDVFSRVQSSKKGSDVYSEEELFPASSTTKLADVLKYLESLPCSKIPRMKFGSKILDEDQIKVIEQMTSILNKNPDTVKLKVKPRLLFRPLANQGSLVPDPEADFELYDRVVVVKSGYSVPFGKRGTVVGVPAPEDEEAVSAHTVYDVVFDEEFAGGITLRCSPNKGYRVPGSAMLNITYGEFRKDRPKADQARFPGNQQRQNRGQYGPGRSGVPNTTNNNSNGGNRPGNQDKQTLWRQQQQQQLQQQQIQSVVWDSKRQPLFGKVFDENGQLYAAHNSDKVVQPKFITPKVQQNQQPMTSVKTAAQMRAESQNSKPNREFEKMWNELQSLQKPTSGAPLPMNIPVQIAQREERVKSVSPSSASATDKKKKTDTTATTTTTVPLKFSLPPSLMNQPPPLLLGSATANEKSESGSLKNVPPVSLLGSAADKIPPETTTTSAQQQFSLPPSLMNQPPPLVLGSAAHTEKSESGSLINPAQASLLGSAAANGKPENVLLKDNTDVRSSTSPKIQNLFDSVAKSQAVERSQADGDQFMALFNSLKLQTEAAKARTASPKLEKPQTQEIAASQADQALKQLLKIGVDLSSSSPTVSASQLSQTIPGQPGTSEPLPSGQKNDLLFTLPTPESSKPAALSPTSQSAAPNYGRQVSLQELFQEADRQQKAQQNQASSHTGRTESAIAENRDPMSELENYCKSNFNGSSPVFDFKHQPKQMVFIANVILPNGQRFEGSQCKTKPEAAKSAASMALLCLKAKQTSGAPMLPGFPPNAARPRMNRFFSPNSAFSPIAMTGPNPNLLPRHPPPPAMLLTPQHFLNQPPPSHPLHQLFQPQPQQQHQQQQQQQQHQQQQNFQFRPPPQQQHQQQQGGGYGQDPRFFQPPQSFQQLLANQSPAAFAKSTDLANSSNVAASTSVPSSGAAAPASSTQQFIPLQVSRNQKTPAKKKDSDSGSQRDSSSSEKTPSSSEAAVPISQAGLDHVSKQTEGSPSLPVSALKETASQQSRDDKQSPNRAEGDQAGSKPSPKVKPAKQQQKKKSRLAANFAKKP